MANASSDVPVLSAFAMYQKRHPSNSSDGRKKKRKRTKPAPKSIPIVAKKPKPQPVIASNGESPKQELKKIKKLKLNKKVETKLKLKKKKITVTKKTVSTVPTFSPSVQNGPTTNGVDQTVSSDSPIDDAIQTFKWMIDPIPPTEFFDKYWEQKVLHIKHNNENYYSHILNSTILDKMLRNNHLNFRENVDVVCYENGKKETYELEGRATPAVVWDYYNNGCSIRILNPHTYCNKVHLLLATLQEYFGNMVGANVYLTPPNSQGFAPHYDDIEAFVLQLEGRKHWKLYQPRPAEVLARFSSQDFDHKDIGEPFMDTVLNAGELLYFPRGTIHEGFTDADAHSLHITVSTYQRTSFADLLEQVLPDALNRASQDDMEFRKGLPLNYLKCVGSSGNLKNMAEKKEVLDMVKKLFSKLGQYLDPHNAADKLGRKFMHDSLPPVLSKSEMERCSKGNGAALDKGRVVNRTYIGLDTRVRLVRYYCVRVVNDENVIKLCYNTENANVYHGQEEQFLELQPNMVESVQMLLNKYPRYVRVKELPLEDEAMNMQFVSDLWEHGLIVTEEPLPEVNE